MTDPQLRWLRLWTDIVHDPKLMMLSPADRWYYVAILTVKRSGMLDEGDQVTVTDRKLSLTLRLTSSELSELKERLIDVRLIDERWQPTGWENRQFESDSSTSRTRKWRRERKRSRNVPETSQERHGDAPEQSQSRAETDKDIRPSAFDRFWSAYPKKVKRKECIDIWKRKRLDSIAERICLDVPTRLATDSRWRAGYIPDPTTYLRNERWNDELQVDKSREAGNGLPVLAA